MMFVGFRRLVFFLLCVVTFLVPWEEILRIPGFKTLVFVASAAALAMASVAVVSRFRMKRLPLALVMLAVFVCWSFVSYLWSADPEATLSRVLTYLSLLLFTWLIWEFVDSRPKRLWLLRSYLLGCCVTLVLLFESYLASKSVFSPASALEGLRYKGGGLDQNTLAFLLTVGIILAAYLATTTGTRWKIAYWLFVLPASVGTLLTGSRAGTIGLVASLGFALMISGFKSAKSVMLFLVVVGCTAWLIPNVVPASLLQRVTQGTESHTFVLREEQWKLGLEMWNESPITGVGAGAFVTAAVARGGRAFVAHNTFVQILTDNGSVGLVLMLAVWCYLAVKAWRLPRQERLLWLGAGVAWAIAAMALSLEYAKITWFLYAWILVERPMASSAHAGIGSSFPPEHPTALQSQDTTREPLPGE